MFRTDAILDPADFYALAEARGVTPVRARKAGKIAVRRVLADEQVTTQWNGDETVNTARPGDVVATSLDAAGAPLRDETAELNQYVITSEVFARNYAAASLPDGSGETPWGDVYAKSATVLAIPLRDGFDIVAPWGARQRAASGYLLLSGGEVYGNAAETFDATYEEIEAV